MRKSAPINCDCSPSLSFPAESQARTPSVPATSLAMCVDEPVPIATAVFVQPSNSADDRDGSVKSFQSLTTPFPIASIHLSRRVSQ